MSTFKVTFVQAYKSMDIKATRITYGPEWVMFYDDRDLIALVAREEILHVTKVDDDA